MEYSWTNEADAAVDPGEGAVLVSSFPSAGLATTVAGHYMIRSLNLQRIGRFDSPDAPPIAVIQDGTVGPTVRVYGQRGLALVLSEFPPTAPQANALARSILDAAESRKARMVLCLEGVVPHPDAEAEGGSPPPDPDAEHVWGAYSQGSGPLASAFSGAGVRPLEDGVIGGVSGALLVAGLDRKVPVAVLLVSAQAAGGLPDHKAGAALIETLDRVMPELKIDTGPLRDQAEQIERALRAAMKRRPDAPPAEPEAPPAAEMYR
jgi:predicted ATP-grasp superfamily ATP-dependent carboligase